MSTWAQDCTFMICDRLPRVLQQGLHLRRALRSHQHPLHLMRIDERVVARRHHRGISRRQRHS